MKLSLSFPADLAEIEGFVLAARTLGANVVQLHIDGEPLGFDAPDDSAELVVLVPAVVPGPLVVEPPSAPEPPAEPPPAPKATTKPKKKERSGKPATGRPVGTEPGTCSHALLTAVADAGGTYDGSLADLARDHGTGADGSRAQMATRLRRDGYLTTTPRTGPTSLTPKGWAAIGRTAPAPRAPEAPAKPDLAAVPDPPAMPDLGPIERRPFDPDRVRQAQASAL